MMAQRTAHTHTNPVCGWVWQFNDIKLISLAISYMHIYIETKRKIVFKETMTTKIHEILRTEN